MTDAVDCPATSAPPPTRPPLWRVVAFVLLALAILAGLPYVSGIPPRIGMVAATVLVLLVSLLVIREAARWPLAPLWDAAGLLLGLAAWHGLGSLVEGHSHLRPLLGATGDTLFLLACVFCGRLLALIIRERGILLPVAIMAGLADIFTVFFGPTQKALQHVPKAVAKLSVGIPQLGSATGAAGGAGLSHIATAGLGDFIFLTFFFVSIYRFGLRAGRTFALVFGLLLAAMLGVLLLPKLPALPLLPFIVLGFLLANAGAFKLTRSEKINTVIVVVLVTGLLVAAAFAMRG